MQGTIYYIYQITNLINGKIYIGVHKTSNIEDGYMGSGTYLKRAQEEYGIENFEKRILKFFESEEEMFQEEAKIVTTDFLSRKDVYNLRKGGTGGFAPYATERALAAKTPEKLKEISILGNAAKQRKYPSGVSPRMLQYSRSEENKEKLRKVQELANSAEALKKKKDTFQTIQHQHGEKNSQYGTMWITDGSENRKIRKNEDIPQGWKKGRVLGGAGHVVSPPHSK